MQVWPTERHCFFLLTAYVSLVTFKQALPLHHILSFFEAPFRRSCLPGWKLYVSLTIIHLHVYEPEEVMASQTRGI